MIRFFRMAFFLMGLLLYLCVAARMIQPATPTDNYVVIVGDRSGSKCCFTYMVNPAKNEANRARISVVEQSFIPNPISPSNQWKFVQVQVRNGRQAFFIHIDDEALMRLPDEVGVGRFWYWDLNDDVLYYFGGNGAFTMALYRITPENPTPKRLTGFLFQDIRAIHQQPLPLLPQFTPWVLLFWSINVLLIAGALRPQR